ncbi:H-NS histone family protein [Devosia enhydra]|uniref:H-NS histone family protein n=1 Tax=Devosia enhydra TaxID=665118 RepID=A0A1K2HSU8_9HYPH|nr:H-NS histone family protein [Devosia enhydra]SFZ80858.1 H-NS histone family protein [Devosia enhydra]
MNDMKDPAGTPRTKSLFHPHGMERTASGSSNERQAPSMDPVADTVPRLIFSGSAGDNGESEHDLDGLSMEALQTRRAEVERKIQEKREADRRAAIDRIVTLVNTHNIPVDDLVQALGGLKRRLGPAPQKYRDPETGATWSGRGKEPLWLRGKDRTQFMITSEQPT